MIYDAGALKARIEAGRTIGAPTSTRLAVTGEPYVVVGSQDDGIPSQPGTVDEGLASEWGFDPETAFFMALNCFAAYARDKPGKIYWRVTPRLEEHTVNHLTREKPVKRFRFYMRLLVSDKPETQQIAPIKAA